MKYLQLSDWRVVNQNRWEDPGRRPQPLRPPKMLDPVIPPAHQIPAGVGGLYGGGFDEERQRGKRSRQVDATLEQLEITPKSRRVKAALEQFGVKPRHERGVAKQRAAGELGPRRITRNLGSVRRVY